MQTVSLGAKERLMWEFSREISWRDRGLNLA